VSGYRLDDGIERFIASFSLRNAGNTAQAVAKNVASKVKCGFDTSVACHTRKGRLFEQIMFYILVSVLAVTILRLLHLGALASLALPLLFLLSYPVIMNRTYGLQYACSISLAPVVPVCLVSEVQDLVYRFTPATLPWPAPLVQRRDGVVNSTQVFDCTTLGFGTGVRELGYALETYAPQALDLFPSLFVSTNTPIPRLLGHFNSSLIEKQCAALYGFTVVPVLLLLAAACVLFFVVVHIAVAELSAVLALVKNMILTFLAVFLAVKQ